MRIASMLLAVCAVTLLATGCAKDKGPATQTLESIETSLKDVRADAAKYAPDGLKGVEAQYERLKVSLDAKEYDNVLAGTPSLEKAVDSLKNAVSSGKKSAAAAAQIAKSEWATLKDEVPKMVDAIDARVDELGKAKRLPRGISKDEFEGAKSIQQSLKATWAEASDEFKSGKQVSAANKGKTAKGMAEELYDRLDIKRT